jgi:hypothetical protein
MNNEYLIGNGCAFEIRCVPAQQVKLVIERRQDKSRIYPLCPRGEGVWGTVLDLECGEYRYCYHAYDGRMLTYLLPTDAPLDGLKAVLRVNEVSKLETRLRMECI